jgi:hypothetical protein
VVHKKAIWARYLSLLYSTLHARPDNFFLQAGLIFSLDAPP